MIFVYTAQFQEASEASYGEKNPLQTSWYTGCGSPIWKIAVEIGHPFFCILKGV